MKASQRSRGSEIKSKITIRRGPPGLRKRRRGTGGYGRIGGYRVLQVQQAAFYRWILHVPGCYKAATGRNKGATQGAHCGVAELEFLERSARESRET